MLKLYEDKKQTFKCKLKIEGADLGKAKARMVLNGSDMDYIFNGKIDNHGQCVISFPALENFESKSGRAILEVIVENGYFEPLKLDYEIKRHNLVEVTDIEIDDDSKDSRIVVESVDDSADADKENKIKKEEMKRFKRVTNEYKKLSKSDKQVVREAVEIHKPTKGSLDLAKKIFPDSDSFAVKLYMYDRDK